MKHIPHIVPTLILSALFIFPAFAQAEESLWDKARQTASKGLEATRKGAEEAAAWSREKSAAAWDATREGAARASEWSREKADELLQATREGAADALEALKGKEENAAREAPRDGRIF